MQGDAGKSRVEPELSGGGQSAASIGQADTKADRLFGPNPSGLDESPHGMMVLVIVGMIVGLLSGMFGIGGGTTFLEINKVSEVFDCRNAMRRRPPCWRSYRRRFPA